MQQGHTSPNTAVVLMSGGLDSAVTACIASQHYQLAFLHVQYGQTHAEKELECFYKLVEYFKPAHVLVTEAPILKMIGKSSLTDPNAPVEHVVVPFRNTILLSMAVAWAETLPAQAVYIGVTKDDYEKFPDCREEYLAAFQQVVNLGTVTCAFYGKPIKVVAPLIHLTKREIVQLGVKLNAPISLTWSCYFPQEDGQPCGQCIPCRLRQEALKAISSTD